MTARSQVLLECDATAGTAVRCGRRTPPLNDSTDDGARIYWAARGWVCTGSHDVCPLHARAAGARP